MGQQEGWKDVGPLDQHLSKPRSIFFFNNGTAAVCNGLGQQMPEYQVGDHSDTIAALARDGHDWRAIPERLGSPIT